MEIYKQIQKEFLLEDVSENIGMLNQSNLLDFKDTHRYLE